MSGLLKSAGNTIFKLWYKHFFPPTPCRSQTIAEQFSSNNYLCMYARRVFHIRFCCTSFSHACLQSLCSDNFTRCTRYLYLTYAYTHSHTCIIRSISQETHHCRDIHFFFFSFFFINICRRLSPLLLYFHKRFVLVMTADLFWKPLY